MHKKKASLVPLNYDFTISSEQEEVEGEGPIPDVILQSSPSSGTLSRKAPGRPKSPDASPCSCNSTAVPSRAGSTLLTSIQVDHLLSSSDLPTAPPMPMADVPFSVDGHRATVSLTPTDLRINYSSARSCCCIPSQRTETILLSEILSAQPLPPVTTKWLWHPFAETTHRLAIYTFRRSPRSPAHWAPRHITLSTTAEGVAQQWAAAINTTVASHVRRPRQLLVLINPFGGKRQAVDVYNRDVGPVFEKAGIKTAVCRTQFSGHARNLILDMSASELASYDGVVAVGGDGLFHEIVNGLLSLRSLGVKRTTSETAGDALTPLVASQNISEDESKRKAAAAVALRVGHIPAGSTDAVACTLNGTRNAFSAAMRIALGDSVPLDVLRIDAADGTTEFTTCMASYGFMGDLMAASETLRWLGPLRYELVGAKMLAANRSYRVRISYLPAEKAHPASFSRICSTNCDLCARPSLAAASGHCTTSPGLTSSSFSAAADAGGGSGFSLGSSGSAGKAGTGGSASSPLLFSTASSSGAVGGGASSTRNGRKSNGSGCGGVPSPPHHHHMHPSSIAASSSPHRSPFARHSRLSMNHRQRDWVTVEDDFAGIMLVIMPCRSDKSAAGVARYGHLSDGNIHLVMVRRCSRLQYLRFLLTMSSTGLEAGRHHGGIVEVVPAVAVRIEPGAAAQESLWNVDGELLRCAAITAETHRGVIDVFARGVETEER